MLLLGLTDPGGGSSSSGGLGLALGGAGNVENGNAGVRYGGSVGDKLQYRVWGKYFNRGPMATSTGDEANDRWNSARGGARIDWQINERDLLTIHGEVRWLVVLLVMVSVSSWIGLRTVPGRRRGLYWRACLAIAVGGGIPFVLVTQFVLELSPWYYARYAIPLAGMIFANAMTSVSLAAERFYAEHERGLAYEEARRIALAAALIPITNAMLENAAGTSAKSTRMVRTTCGVCSALGW